VPFLPAVIAALVDGRLIEGFEPRKEPARLADLTFYLPTRRAMRQAREVFLAEMNASAMVLPRIVALGDIDEDELAFAGETDPLSGTAPLDVPPALGELERRLTLARLVGAWAKGPVLAPLVVGGPASTLALAQDLARLIDDMVTRDVDWGALDGLVPDQLDPYWQHSLEFLRIAQATWPLYLREINRIEPAARRDLLITAEAARLSARPDKPVLAAGSTGSMPATARFLSAVAGLSQGAVVLPGLDTELDEEAWQRIGGVRDTAGRVQSVALSNHPQYALHNLLRTMGIRRTQVEILSAPLPGGRDVLASEIMRPSTTTDKWHEQLRQDRIAQGIAQGMSNVAVVEAENPEIEALAIAIIMREARHLGRSAALVTADRALARRVMAALGRWQLAFDDSGGDALMDTGAGIFARLAARAATEGLEPATLLALLKHPRFRLGRAQGEWKAAIEALELALLRGTRPGAGSAALEREFARFATEIEKFRRQQPCSLHRSEPRARLSEEDVAGIAALIAALGQALAPMEALSPARTCDFVELARAHRAIVIALSADPGGVAGALLNRDGAALARAFEDLLGAEVSGLELRPADYAETFETAFADRAVRRSESHAARLQILGPLESRLMRADRVIIGGLVEGVWPPTPRIDPWLSRPMRHELGLDLPERRIGLSAHDFVQLLGADEVIFTHAAKSGGAPAVASRFLHRLEAIAGPHWKAACDLGARYVAYAHALDRPDQVVPVAPPCPKPPQSSRPLQLSVTAIEHLLRDPYTIYARYILRLVALDAVDTPLSRADRGSAIHEALRRFAVRYAHELPADAVQILCAIGEECFAPLMEHAEARALWWPRFQRVAAWYVDWERQRRSSIAAIHAEVAGAITIALAPQREFRLTARADRIERDCSGQSVILDFKTTTPPTGKQVCIGLSPQLPLEAAILREGGFEGLAAGLVRNLVYVHLSGNNPPGEEIVLELRRNKGDTVQSADEAAVQARARLETLIRAFDDEAQGYISLNLPMWTNRYGSYDDLARVKEWSALVGEE